MQSTSTPASASGHVCLVLPGGCRILQLQASIGLEDWPDCSPDSWLTTRASLEELPSTDDACAQAMSDEPCSKR